MNKPRVRFDRSKMIWRCWDVDVNGLGVSITDAYNGYCYGVGVLAERRYNAEVKRMDQYDPPKSCVPRLPKGFKWKHLSGPLMPPGTVVEIVKVPWFTRLADWLFHH